VRPPAAIRGAHRWIAAVLTAGILISFIGYMFQLWPLTPVLLFILGDLLFVMFVRRHVHEVLASVEMPARDLRVLAELLQRLERESLETGLLASLKARIVTKGVPASIQIGRLRRLI